MTVGKDDRREQKRKHIIRAALKIFSKSGYTPALLDDIAGEAGIAKGTLYLYFKDKEDLFHSTIMSIIYDLEELLKKNISEDMEPLVMLENMARMQLDFFLQNSQFFTIYQAVLNYNLLSNYTNLFEEISVKVKELIRVETDIVNEGKTRGIFRSDLSTENIVIVYHGMVYQMIEWMIVFKRDGGFDTRKKARELMDIFINGIGK